MREPHVLASHLPLRARARLRAESHIDGAAGWLAGHRCSWAAILLWRACGMW